MKKGVTLFFCIVLMSSGAYAKKSKTGCYFDTLYTDKSTVEFDFNATHLIDKQLLEGLQQGLTATVEYRVQLWRRNRYLPDTIEKERIRRMKIGYDRWQKSYQLTEPGDNVSSYSERGIIQKCGSLQKFCFSQPGLLETGREYRIIIRVIVRKMSLENYQEVKTWLQGRAEDIDLKKIRPDKKAGKKATGWFMNALFTVTGFGDKVVTGKSRWFTAGAGN